MVKQRIPPHSCSGCDARWDGFNTAHCAGCHETFTTLRTWELHRTGTFSKGRTCLPIDQTVLVSANRSYPCWAQPGTYDREET